LFGAVLLAPADRIAPNGGVTPAIAETAQLLDPSSLSSLRGGKRREPDKDVMSKVELPD
jgi:hypothetical protein